MDKFVSCEPAPGMKIHRVERNGAGLTVFLSGKDYGCCPSCGTRSASRHSSYSRHLKDLPAHGGPVTAVVTVTRWRCRNAICWQRIFSGADPLLATPYARQTSRIRTIIRLFGHGVGGRPSERIMARIGIAVFHTSILRQLKANAPMVQDRPQVRVAGIDEWASRKGMTCETVIVDLERHEVVDLLPDPTAASVAKRFINHPEVEYISRDRAGVYADGARQGAPQARQGADRFHLLMNFRETVAREMNGIGPPIRETILAGNDHELRDQEFEERERVVASTRREDRQAVFEEIRALYDSGKTVREITLQLGIGRRRVERWVRRIAPPERNIMEPKSCIPAGFGAFLERRRGEGITNGRQLFGEIVERGYTGSYSHLARFLSPRTDAGIIVQKIAGLAPQQARDPVPGRLISALTAAALCMKPRNQLTDRQQTHLAALKAASAAFTTTWRLAMRFRGILRGRDSSKLNPWLRDAEASGIYGMRRFVRALRLDIDAVRNAIDEGWSNVQVEGQINKLKMLKRAMHGRASLPVLRARMMPM